MNKVLLILLFSFYVFLSKAQINTFNVGILPNGTYPSGAVSIMENDTGFVLIGFGPLGKLVVSVIDTFGNFKLSKIYERQMYSYRMSFDGLCSLNNNNNYVYSLWEEKYDSSQTYYSSLLIKFNENFDTIFTKSYFTDTSYSGSYSCIQNKDGNYVIIGENSINTTYSYLLLFSTDTLGNLLWQKKYGGNFGNRGFLILQTYDNGYLLGGKSNSFGSNSQADNGEWYLVKTDSLGNQQWQRHYGNPTLNDEWIMDMCTTLDSCYLLAGYYAIERNETAYTQTINKSRLVKIDQNGNIIWDKLYGYKGRNNEFKSIEQIENGDIITMLYTDSLRQYCGDINCILQCLSSEGEVKWRRKYFFNNDTCSLWSRPYVVKSTNDGGFIFAGIGASYDMTPGQYTWIVKTDSLGFDNTYCCGDTTLNITLVTDTVCYGDSALVFFHLTGKSAPYKLQLDNGSFHDSVFYPYTYENYAIDSLYIYPQDSLVTQQITATLTDPFGETYTDTFSVYIKACESSLIEHANQDNKIKIYPNPANTEINIEFTKNIENIKIEIFNNIGQIVYSADTKNNIEKIDISKFSSGMYFVKLSNSNLFHIEKIVLK